MKGVCESCKAEWSGEFFDRVSACPVCDAPTKPPVCRNCKHYHETKDQVQGLIGDVLIVQPTRNCRRYPEHYQIHTPDTHTCGEFAEMRTQDRENA